MTCDFVSGTKATSGGNGERWLLLTAMQLGAVQAADVYFDRTKSGEKVVVRVREKFQVSICFDVKRETPAFHCGRWSHCLEALLTSNERRSVSNTSNVRSIQLHANSCWI